MKIAISKEKIRDIIIAICFFAIFFSITKFLMPKMNKEQIMWTGVIMIVAIIGGVIVYAELRAYFQRRKQKKLNQWLQKPKG